MTSSTTRCAPTGMSATGGQVTASRSIGGASTRRTPTSAPSPCTAPRSRCCAASSATSSTKRLSSTWTPATASRTRTRSTGGATGASSRPTGRLGSRCRWRLRGQTDGQSLELVDERRLDVRRLPRHLVVRVARQQLVEHDLQLEAGKCCAEAEVPPTGAEALVVGVAFDVEALRVLELRLVAVRGDVPHDHLLAVLDGAAGDFGVLGGRATEVREGREHPD